MMKRLLQGLLISCFILSQLAATVMSQENTSQSPAPTTEIKQLNAPSPVQPAEPTTGIHLTLSPVFINITTNPGLDVTSDFKVTNNSNVKENLKVTLIKFKADASGANIVPIDIDSSDEFAHWISFSDPEFSLDPNETKTIKFTINTPKTAALGYYYGIRVGRLKEKQGKGNEAIISGSAVITLLMEVRSPNAKKQLSIVDFSAKPIYEYLPVDFAIKVKNSGNVHTIPFGDIFIDQGSRKEISVVKVNDGRGNVLPQTTRTFNATWQEGFPLIVLKKNGESVVTDKNGKPVYTTQWDFSKAANFRIGKYTANLVLVYNDGKRDVPLSATVSFWVIPWKILIGAFVVLLLVLLGLKSLVTPIFKKR